MTEFSTEPFLGIFTLAVFGFTGSLHCAGMCGPIAASTSRHGKSRDVTVYHASRIAAYSFIGFALGLLTSTFLKNLPDLQSFHGRYLGIILGTLMLLYAALEVAANFGWTIPSARPWLQRLIRKLPFSEPLVLGITTALLPCGFLYAAFLQSSVLAHPVASALGMAVFALSTTPALGFGGALFLWLQKKTPRLAPWISALALFTAGLAVIIRSLPHDHQAHHRSGGSSEQQHQHP